VQNPVITCQETVMLIVNRHAARAPYPAELRAILNIERAQESRRCLSAWPGISRGATPLHDLPDLAQSLGVARLSVKDESVRSPLGSFKALGAPIALIRQILRWHPDLEPIGILEGRYAHLFTGHTVISATDGNHGRGLAARDAGCRCVIVLHAHVSVEREQAIAALGAEIVRVLGNYDASVAEAARLAAAHGWQVVSDTSYEGYEDIPRDVMQGYGIIAAELVEQTGAKAGEAGAFSHVFLQGGVGGLAAGLVSYLWEHQGANRPCFVVVEPAQADCLLQSAIEGSAANATGSVDSIMAGLACGETSPLAWQFLKPGIDYFMTIEDAQVVAAMRVLAQGSHRDIPIVAGESGVAGLVALRSLRDDADLSACVGLDARSRVLIINTEGATAAGTYQELVGESADSVRARQAGFISRRPAP